MKCWEKLSIVNLLHKPVITTDTYFSAIHIYNINILVSNVTKRLNKSSILTCNEPKCKLMKQWGKPITIPVL